MLRGAGIVALFVLLMACGESSAAQKASPSVAPVQHTWNQDLTLAGDVSGHMTGIVADVGTQTSACTGAKPRPGETWSTKFYGTIDASGAVWGIDFVIQNYGGSGVYKDRAIEIQVHDAGSGKVWLSMTGDAVTFTLDRTQQSGTVDATLTNADSGKAASLHLLGHWNCRA